MGIGNFSRDIVNIINRPFLFRKLIMEYMKSKLDSRCPIMFVEVARILIDMIKVSYRFENELCAEKGIGKIFDMVRERDPQQLF